MSRFVYDPHKLAEFLESVKREEDIVPVLPVENDMRHYYLLQTAANELGEKEIPGKGSNSRIEMYHRYSTVNNDKGMSDDVPWCSSFVCFVTETSAIPMQSTNSKMARSWEGWGRDVTKDPLPGDIIVFWRGSKSAGTGHVGIYLRKTRSGFYYVLGGNQSDMVNVSTYAGTRITSIRRSSKALVYTDAQKQMLLDLAEDIISGGYSPGGKVT